MGLQSLDKRRIALRRKVCCQLVKHHTGTLLCFLIGFVNEFVNDKIHKVFLAKPLFYHDSMILPKNDSVSSCKKSVCCWSLTNCDGVAVFCTLTVRERVVADRVILIS